MQLLSNLANKLKGLDLSDDCLSTWGNVVSLALYSAHSLKLAGADSKFSQTVAKVHSDIVTLIAHQFEKPFQIHAPNQTEIKVEEVKVSEHTTHPASTYSCSEEANYVCSIIAPL